MERQIDLVGCNNFRDLGGYPTAGGGKVRWRRVFRADGLQRLTEADISHLTGEIGLSDVIDLRSTHELNLDGRGRLEHEPVGFHHLPLFDGGPIERQAPPPDLSLADMYLGMLERAQDPIANVLRALAQADGAAVYHCAAGKDRTGVISAVLLALLDVPDEVLVADYAATKENLDAIIARLQESRGYDAVYKELPPETLHAEPQTMIDLLDSVKARYGSFTGYALDAGLTEDLIAKLREKLVE